MKESLNFYTTGKDMNNLYKDYFMSGEFKLLHILLDQGEDCTNRDKIIERGFKLQLDFSGDTRDDGSLNIDFLDSEKDYGSNLMTALRSLLIDKLNDGYDLLQCLVETAVREKDDEYERLQYLFQVISKEDVLKYISKEYINQGFDYIEKKDLTEKRITFFNQNDMNGVILKNGDLILCSYMQHSYLYHSYLFPLGITKVDDWLEDCETIHISSCQVNGKVAHKIEENYEKEEWVSKEQIEVLFLLRNILQSTYGRDTSISELIRRYTERMINRGGKYNNLMFLKTYYNFNLPDFSLEPLFEDYSEDVFLRTSPKLSLPGLLHSKLINNDPVNREYAIKQLEKDFEEYRKVHSEKNWSGEISYPNELNYFFQQYLEGSNGVCNIIDGKVNYQLSENQGDVVKGVITNEKLSQENYSELVKIVETLYKDIEQSLQVEFVISGDKVFIVQLRLLENNPLNDRIEQKDDKFLYEGKSFSKRGVDNVLISDILIVDSEADSKQLIGKKALIVRNNVEFSHILALSKVLKIPSMYATGDIDLSKYDSISIKTFCKNAIISKI